MKATLLTTEEYNAYYDPYIKALGNVDLFQAFNETEKEFLNLINSIPEEKLHYSYGIGKWTVAEDFTSCGGHRTYFSIQSFTNWS